MFTAAGGTIYFAAENLNQFSQNLNLYTMNLETFMTL